MKKQKETFRPPDMAASLLIKPSQGFMMPEILATKYFGRQPPHLQAKSCRLFSNGPMNSNLSLMLTVGEKQKSRTRLPSILATYQSLLVSYPTTITVSPPETHQVFINFRGEQLRHNFVSHLINAFKRHEIKFFIDKYEQLGKDLKTLFVRIEESRIAFSSSLPELKWCMNELVKMKKLSDEGKLHVIPIFYKVEESHVRKPTRESEFGKKFWNLMEASDMKDPIQEWREALECISNKMGLSLGDNCCEADFVKKIVNEVGRVNEAIGLE